MERTAVVSSNIKSVGYEPGTAAMEVEFANGAVYRYEGVPESAHQALMGAESIGAHFQKVIRPAFKGTKVPG